MGKHYVCDKHKTKGNTGKCPFCYPGHIADATGKAQPAPALPGDDGEICARLLSACTGHPHALIPWPHRLLHDAVSHISDLTRRLAEVEAELADMRHQRDVNSGLWQTQKDICARKQDEIYWLRDAKEGTEARVRELEATIDAMAEAHAHDDMALTAAYLNGHPMTDNLRDRIAGVLEEHRRVSSSCECGFDLGISAITWHWRDHVADAVIEALGLREERTETETVTNEQGATWFRQGGYRYVSEWIDND